MLVKEKNGENKLIKAFSSGRGVFITYLEALELRNTINKLRREGVNQELQEKLQTYIGSTLYWRDRAEKLQAAVDEFVKNSEEILER